MRYIGGKTRLLPEIHNLVESKIKDNSKTFLDLFSGTGSVGNSFKPHFTIYANDLLYFCYLLAAGTLVNNIPPAFKKLKKEIHGDVLDYLNCITPAPDESYFVLNNYSPFGNSKRQYFTTDNAGKIDAIRQKIKYWFSRNKISVEEKNYLLACLIEAVSSISNTTGTYGAYLKSWDKRAFKKLTLEHPILFNNGKENKAFNNDAIKLAKDLVVDICYIDPPYNTRQYSSNYHLLETIALYDYPKITGVTGIRDYSKRKISPFSRKRDAYDAFNELIKNVNAKHIIISYSSDGILSKKEISDILHKHCDKKYYHFEEIKQNAYQSKIVRNSSVNEYLFYIKK